MSSSKLLTLGIFDSYMPKIAHLFFEHSFHRLVCGREKLHLTETTLDIIELLGKEPFTGESIRSIAQRLTKAYPLVHDHISRLKEAGLLLEETVGKARRITLNLSHPEAQLLLGYTTTRNTTTTKLTKKVLALNNEHTLLTACSHGDQTWIVADEEQQESLKEQLPFTEVKVLGEKEFLHLLLETARYGELPTPLLHNATFYDFIGKLQQVFNNWGERR